jgi:mono/diheme cytochrome c family protein
MTNANAAAGAALFAQYCSQCHGQDGKSSHSGAPDITTINSPRTVISMLLNGRNGMPSFAKILKPDEIRDVSAFVSQGLTTTTSTTNGSH